MFSCRAISMLGLYTGYREGAEPDNFAQQAGVFEIHAAPQPLHQLPSGIRHKAAASQNTAAGSQKTAAGSQKTATGSQKTATGSQNTVAGSQNTVTGSQKTASHVLQQVMLQPPVHWCPVPIEQPVTVIGNYNW